MTGSEDQASVRYSYGLQTGLVFPALGLRQGVSKTQPRLDGPSERKQPGLLGLVKPKKRRCWFPTF